MKQIIKRVLEEISTSQVNLTSAAARDMVADEIESALKESGDYKKMTAEEFDRFKAKETWVCGICGQNTYDVDWDYIGSGTNHLGCELEQITQKKHEDKVFGKPGKWREDIKTGHDQGGSYEKKIWPGSDAIQKQIYNEMTSDGLPEGGDAQAVLESHKLADEIVDNKGKWIYESPDSGKTVFRRPFGDYDMKNKEEIDLETKEPTGRKFTEYPFNENIKIQLDGC